MSHSCALLKASQHQGGERKTMGERKQSSFRRLLEWQATQTHTGHISRHVAQPPQTAKYIAGVIFLPQGRWKLTRFIREPGTTIRLLPPIEASLYTRRRSKTI